MTSDPLESGTVRSRRVLLVICGPLLVLSAIFFAFLTPPFEAPDEAGHFFRAWQLASGRSIDVDGGGGPLPSGTVSIDARLERGIPFHPEKKIELPAILAELETREGTSDLPARFAGALLYTPVPYLPQVLAITVTRTFSDRPLVSFYAARLMNALAGSALLVASVAIIPVFPVTLALLAMTPMASFLRGSCSADVVTMGLSFLVFALVLEKLMRPFSLRNRMLLLSTSALLCLCKPVYFLIPLLALLPLGKGQTLDEIPLVRGSERRRLESYFEGILLGIVSLSTIVSMTYARGHYRPLRPLTSVPGQMLYVQAHPLTLLRIILVDAAVHGPRYLSQLIGKLGYLDVALPGWLIITYCLLLLCTAFREGQDMSIPLSIKALFTGCFVAMTAGILFSQYTLWSPVGASEILGIQGRYFLPIVPLLMVLAGSGKPSKLPRLHPLTIAASAGLANLIATYAVICRYYRH